MSGLPKNLKRVYDVADVLARLGLKVKATSGDNLQLCCPFHNDGTPSFSISIEPDKSGVWHCFGCLAGGNLEQLVAKVQRTALRKARLWLDESPSEWHVASTTARACPVDHGTGSRSQMLIEATSIVPW